MVVEELVVGTELEVVVGTFVLEELVLLLLLLLGLVVVVVVGGGGGDEPEKQLQALETRYGLFSQPQRYVGIAMLVVLT